MPAAGTTPFVAVNQVGYLPGGAKHAAVVSHESRAAATVNVVSLDDGMPVAQVRLERSEHDPLSKKFVQPVDFSTLTRPGRYYLEIDGLKSYPFDVAPRVYDEAIKLLLRSYYLQRCGVALDDQRTGLTHAACHLEDALRPRDDVGGERGTRVHANGGWHDAGDFGKYVATTTIALGRLLSAYEQYPQVRHDDWLDIPESGNGTPDLLDEARVGLEWLYRMQRIDGAVYRKLSGSKWPPIVRPEDDRQPRYIYGPSSSDTAKYAATMALAARVWNDVDKRDADSYLQAALRAWAYLETLPGQTVDWTATDDTGSGRYLHSEVDAESTLLTDVDDRLWAAAELWITTGQTHYRTYLTRALPETTYTLFEWKNPAPLGVSNAWRHARSLGLAELTGTLAREIDARADALTAVARNNPWRLANTLLIWGSNKMAAEDGITLALARARVQGASVLAQAQLDYLLGVNPFNQTFVTALGTRPVDNVHHIFGRAVSRNIPGLMVGGPNEDAQAGIAPKRAGLMSYIDDVRSYATNEYAIDYNAAIIGLLMKLQYESD